MFVHFNALSYINNKNCSSQICLMDLYFVALWNILSLRILDYGFVEGFMT